MADLYELDGTVERVVFHNENNQYTVMEMETDNDAITVVGIFPYINKGEELKIYGEWTYHQSFGQQFKAHTFERVRPSTVAAISRYLSSGAIKGIGKATAIRIVDAFGENSLDVIENDPTRLTQIKGITKEKAEAISEEMKKIYGIRELMLYLSNYGVRPEDAIKVWKMYKTDSIYLVKENPYCLCHEFIGISFAIADSIAMSMDKPNESKGRVCAGIIHVLRHNANNGHSCIPVSKLISTAKNMLTVSIEITKESLLELCESGDLICKSFNEEEFIFLPKYFKSEEYIAERINLMLRYPAHSITNIEGEILNVEKTNNINYADLQKKAIRAALEKGLLILTGGPGTGKTTTLNGIISILKRKGEKVFLAAPTGRAAKRMSELTGEDSKTIHRMLQVDWDDQDNPIFIKNEKNPLECDTVIVDEMSMVDIPVMEGLISAMPLGCRLILVGDTDQLPSVGAGNVLGDLIASDIIPTIMLKEIFRQARESLIVMNSHRIVKGDFPDITKVNSDFFFMQKKSDEELVSTVSDLIAQRLPKTYSYSPADDIQILCPSKKGTAGTEQLNSVIRERLNPASEKKNQHDIMGTIFREGDKVMHIKNNYELPWEKPDGTMGQGVFNGDIGMITKIDKHGGIIKVKIDDKFATYEFEQAGKELEHAYAITVHKSQGNEFPAVIMPLFKTTDKLKYRNLLYTGVTRAKSILILIGEKYIIEQMIKNDRKTLRYTGLKNMILENLK
ncbi:MAG: ATP-dependent RecD-like DNA helicase [Clostridia bacterium]